MTGFAVQTKLITGLVSHIQRFSLNDGPGIRTTVFLKGCPLHCPWCHNPETIHSKPEINFMSLKCSHCGTCEGVCPVPGAIDMKADYRINKDVCTLCMKCVDACPYGAFTKIGEILTVDDVIKEVERDSLFYANSGGGMTISGGEPLLQADFAAGLLKKAKEKAFHTCVDTSGYGSFETLEKLVPYTDLFLYDIKQLDDSIHQKLTGVSNKLILENLKKIANCSNIRLRIPLIPGVNDDALFLRELVRLAVSLKIKAVDILPYHTFCVGKYQMLNQESQFYRTELPDNDAVSRIVKQLQESGLEVTIGG